MKEKLINALGVAIDALEKKTVTYDWKTQASCNCGIVFQAIAGLSPNSLTEKVAVLIEGIPGHENHKGGYTWKEITKNYCPLTGVADDVLFKELQEAGMTREDIFNLEFLADEKVLEKLNLDSKKKEDTIKPVKFLWVKIGEKKVPQKPHYEEEGNLLLYLKAWKEVLESE